MSVDIVVDLALFVNTPAKAESLQYSLEQPAGVIGLTQTQTKESYCLLNKKWQFLEISQKIHIRWQLYLIYWKQYQSRHRESMGYYCLVDHLGIWSL